MALSDQDLYEVEGIAGEVRNLASEIQALASMEIDGELEVSAPFGMDDLEGLRMAKGVLSNIIDRRNAVGEEG